MYVYAVVPRVLVIVYEWQHYPQHESDCNDGQLKSFVDDLIKHMLAYQMEFGYDLSISPDDNVSSNPGFESVLGVLITG